MTSASLQRVVRFIAVGLMSNLLGLAVFQLLVWNGLPPEGASFVSFFPAFAFAYLVNKMWAFKSSGLYRETLIRYFLATIFALAVQICIVFILYRWIGILPIFCQLIALAVTVPINYVVLRLWVFPENKNGRSQTSA